MSKRETLRHKFYRTFIVADLHGHMPVFVVGAYYAKGTAQEWLKESKKSRMFDFCWAILTTLAELAFAIGLPLNLWLRRHHIVFDGGAYFIFAVLELVFVFGSWYFISVLRWMRRNWNKPRSTKIEW